MSNKSSAIKKQKEKVIGFALDGVLRNISRSLDTTYRKCFPTRPVKTPINPYNILDSYSFDNQEEFANFLTSEAVTVFGRAEEVSFGVVHEFNKVISILKQNGYKPLLISKEVGKTKPATMFFLAFTGCEASDVRFITKTEEFWDDVDILVTPNPDVIALRPPRKRAIKLHKSYNRDVKHVRKIAHIKDLPKFLGISEVVKSSTTPLLQAYDKVDENGVVTNNSGPQELEKSNEFIDQGVIVGNASVLGEYEHDGELDEKEVSRLLGEDEGEVTEEEE